MELDETCFRKLCSWLHDDKRGYMIWENFGKYFLPPNRNWKKSECEVCGYTHMNRDFYYICNCSWNLLGTSARPCISPYISLYFSLFWMESMLIIKAQIFRTKAIKNKGLSKASWSHQDIVLDWIRKMSNNVTSPSTTTSIAIS
jgi:hypothetical protein